MNIFMSLKFSNLFIHINTYISQTSLYIRHLTVESGGGGPFYFLPEGLYHSQFAPVYNIKQETHEA